MTSSFQLRRLGLHVGRPTIPSSRIGCDPVLGQKTYDCGPPNHQLTSAPGNGRRTGPYETSAGVRAIFASRLGVSVQRSADATTPPLSYLRAKQLNLPAISQFRGHPPYLWYVSMISTGSSEASTIEYKYRKICLGPPEVPKVMYHGGRQIVATHSPIQASETQSTFRQPLQSTRYSERTDQGQSRSLPWGGRGIPPYRYRREN